jgi:hypothetical protein
MPVLAPGKEQGGLSLPDLKYVRFCVDVLHEVGVLQGYGMGLFKYGQPEGAVWS